MSEPVELRPCPFCGGKASRTSMVRTRVRCLDCDAATGCYDDIAEAFAAWNRRAAAEVPAEVLSAVAIINDVENWLATLKPGQVSSCESYCEACRVARETIAEWAIEQIGKDVRSEPNNDNFQI